MKIKVVDHDGAHHELDALEGWRVMEIIRDWDLPIKAECGGACACATCHVYVDAEWLGRLPDKTDEELDQLEILAERKPNSRLSCQMLMSAELNGLRVTLAPNSCPQRV